jgi:peptide/nickel transport system substrate-binding protein
MIYMIGRWNDVARDLAPKGFVTEGITFGIRGIVPDSGNPSSILSNLKVREALEYAINRPQMVSAIGFGFYTALEQAATPFNNGWIPDYKGRSYNPEKARELLKEAGYPNGFKTTIYAGVHLTGREIESIQAYWKEINVEVNIQMVTPAKWLDLEANGWSDGYYSAGLTSQGTEAIYGTWIKRYWAPDSRRFPCIQRSPEFLDAIKAAFAEPDPDKQRTLYQNVNRLLMKDAIVIPMWYDLAPWTISKKVHDAGITNWEDPAVRSFGKTWLE